MTAENTFVAETTTVRNPVDIELVRTQDDSEIYAEAL
jgi:hypothetical protein